MVPSVRVSNSVDDQDTLLLYYGRCIIPAEEKQMQYNISLLVMQFSRYELVIFWLKFQWRLSWGSNGQQVSNRLSSSANGDEGFWRPYGRHMTSLCHIKVYTGIVLWMYPANERRRYTVASPLIGWALTQNDPRLHELFYLLKWYIWYENTRISNMHISNKWVWAFMSIMCDTSNVFELHGIKLIKS